MRTGQDENCFAILDFDSEKSSLFPGGGRENAFGFGLEIAFTSPSFVSFQSAHITYVSFPVSFPSLLP
jgi:hypothetical protein